MQGYVFENALSYQDIYDGIHLPDIDGVAGGIFSLRLVGSQYPEEQGTWLELPTTDLGFRWGLNRLNERTFDDCIIAESISTVQGLSVKQTDDIETLNELARRIQEFTDDRTLCKFEAALELEQCDSLEQALHIAENLVVIPMIHRCIPWLRIQGICFVNWRLILMIQHLLHLIFKDMGNVSLGCWKVCRQPME